MSENIFDSRKDFSYNKEVKSEWLNSEDQTEGIIKQQYQKYQKQRKSLDDLLNFILNSKEIELVGSKLKQFCVLLVGADEQELFFQYFIENKFLQLLMKRQRSFKYCSSLLRSVFSSFQFLLKALKKDEHFVYFLVTINKQGFISERYCFSDEEDIAYYANFLKLLVRKINEDEKYLAVFMNNKQPNFPLIQCLLKFHDCKDLVMHTSAKLSIMEICNNKNPLVQQYILNFPFVIFYPLFVRQISQNFQQAIQKENNEESLENLRNHLKYMQQFITDKQKQFIEMYTNTFLVLVGKIIYHQFIHLNDKNLKRVKKMMRIILDILIPEISVLKIKIGIYRMLNFKISSRLKKCFESKFSFLENDYWLLQVCEDEIKQHCRSIFYHTGSSSKSFIKTMNSYIPRSKDNWLYYQLKKISQMIGHSINLNQEINHEEYLEDSFLKTLSEDIDDTQNLLPHNILKIRDQELYFYYIKILTQLSDCSNGQKISLDPFLYEINICCSLSLVQAFYNLVIRDKIVVQDDALFQKLYEQVTEKLIYFVLTKGWKQFLKRIKDGLSSQNNNQFYSYVFRDIECEIVLFASIRHILGITNDDCDKFKQTNWEMNKILTSEIELICKQINQFGQSIYLILDGQYIKVKNRQQHLIQNQMLLDDLDFYSQGASIDIVEKNNNSQGNMTIFIQQNPKREYLLGQIQYRKNICSRVRMEIKTMRYDFVN